MAQFISIKRVVRTLRYATHMVQYETFSDRLWALADCTVYAREGELRAVSRLESNSQHKNGTRQPLTDNLDIPPAWDGGTVRASENACPDAFKAIRKA